MQRLRSITPRSQAAVFAVLLWPPLAVGIWLTSSTSAWSPWWLVALLLVFAVATDLTASAGVPQARMLEISACSVAMFSAAVLLGPAPAACIGAIAAVADQGFRRRPWDHLVGNAANYAASGLIMGLLAKPFLGGHELRVGMAAIGLAAFLVGECVSFAIASGLRLLRFRERGLAVAYLRQLAASTPSVLAAGILAVLAIWTYRTGGGVGLMFLAGALLLIQFLLSRLTRVEFELRAQRDRAQAYLDAAGSPFVILDSDHRIETLNRRAEALLGSNEQLAGVAWSELLNADDRGAFRHAIERATHGPARFECLVQARDGSQCAVLWSVVELASVEATGRLLLSGEDITERRAAEDELHRLAMHDPLTGLPNRSAFRDALSRALTAARAHEHALAVVFIDLDEFKAVNDALGHAAGDALLCHVARRLERSVRDHDVVARLSGDEFLVLLDELPCDAADARRLADDVMSRMLDDLHAPYAIDGREVTIGGSSGIALYPADGEDSETLLDLADREMYGRKSPTRAVLGTG